MSYWMWVFLMGITQGIEKSITSNHMSKIIRHNHTSEGWAGLVNAVDVPIGMSGEDGAHGRRPS